MVNSRAKGGVGERELAARLRDGGHPGAYRSQQYCGKGEDSSDVICPSLPFIHFECKRTENLKLYPAMEQAKRDAKRGRVPVVAHRRNDKDWVAIMTLDDFLHLVEEKNIASEHALAKIRSFLMPEDMSNKILDGSAELPINEKETNEKEN